MPVAINGVITAMQPDSIDWQRRHIGTTGTGLPVEGPYYTCVLSFPRTTVVEFEEWYRNKGQLVDMHFPHPKTGILTEYTNVIIHSIEERMGTRGNRHVASGVDITVIRVDAST